MARAVTPQLLLLLLLTLLLTTFVASQSSTDTTSPPPEPTLDPVNSPLSSAALAALAANDFNTPTIPPGQLRDASLRRPPRGGNRRTSRGDPVTGRVPVQEVRFNPQPWGLPYPNPQPDDMILPKPEPWDMTPRNNPIERLVNEAVEQQERKMAADEAASAGKPVPPSAEPHHGRKGRDNVNINNNDNDIVIDLSSLDLGGLGSGKKSGAVVDDDEEANGVCKNKYESAFEEEKTSSKKKNKNKKGDCEKMVEDEELGSCAAKNSGKKGAVKCEKAGRVGKPRKPYKPLLPPTISPAPHCGAHVGQQEEVIVYKTVTVME